VKEFSFECREIIIPHAGDGVVWIQPIARAFPVKVW
jgi:hypothetical protein